MSLRSLRSVPWAAAVLQALCLLGLMPRRADACSAAAISCDGNEYPSVTFRTLDWPCTSARSYSPNPRLKPSLSRQMYLPD